MRIKKVIKNLLERITIVIKRFCWFFYYGTKIILFESHYEYDGNSGALYKYLRSIRKYNRYTFVWIVKGYEDGKIPNTRRDLIFSENNRSLLKKYLRNHASFSFYDDVPIEARGKNAKTIYLTHGQMSLKDSSTLIRVPDDVGYALCVSDFYKPIFCSKFNIPHEKVFICGMPRDDVLFQPKKDVSFLFNPDSYSFVVLWLPTFRKNKYSERNDSNEELPFGIPLFTNLSKFKKLNEFLIEKNMLFVIKLHPSQDLTVISKISFSNIVFIDHQTLINHRIATNDLFPHSHALITDYSSVAIDYMLIDKPLAYLEENKNAYKLNVSQEYYDLMTPGEKIKTTDELLLFLNKICEGIDEYKKERNAFIEKAYRYRDGNNCQRIVERFKL